MRTTSVASAFIVVSGLLGSACIDCWPDEPPRPSTFAPVGETTCTLDADVGSRTFAIEALRVPIRSDEEGALPAVGFDLDGLVSTATDVEGCYTADLPGGLDNGFAVLNEAIADVFGQANVDVDAAIASEVADEVLALELVIADWNETSSDPCISVTLRGAEDGRPIDTLTGRAPLVAGVVSVVTFGASLAIRPTFSVRQGAVVPTCDGDCTAVALAITIRELIARLRFSADMRELLVSESPNSANSTMLGGYVRYTEEDETSFGTQLANLAEVLAEGSSYDIRRGLEARLDLDSTPTLAPCSPVGNVTSADSVSIALLASGTALE